MVAPLLSGGTATQSVKGANNDSQGCKKRRAKGATVAPNPDVVSSRLREEDSTSTDPLSSESGGPPPAAPEAAEVPTAEVGPGPDDDGPEGDEDEEFHPVDDDEDDDDDWRRPVWKLDIAGSLAAIRRAPGGAPGTTRHAGLQAGSRYPSEEAHGDGEPLCPGRPHQALAEAVLRSGHRRCD